MASILYDHISDTTFGETNPILPGAPVSVVWEEGPIGTWLGGTALPPTDSPFTLSGLPWRGHSLMPWSNPTGNSFPVKVAILVDGAEVNSVVVDATQQGVIINTPGYPRYIAGSPGAAVSLSIQTFGDALNIGDNESENVAELGAEEDESGDPPSPILRTNTRATTAVGRDIHDTATISAGDNPTGMLTFRLFGPENLDCTDAPIFESPVTISGNGTYDSEPYHVLEEGLYRWTAEYSGDSNNTQVQTACGEPHEETLVRVARGRTWVGRYG